MSTLSSFPSARPEVLAFLQDIKENPEDDAPRLILADWLEEREDPRAELLRVQCEYARRGRHDPRRKELRKQESRLLAKMLPSWIAPFREMIQEYDYARGLLWVGGEADRFLAGVPAGLEATEEWAWVEEVRLWKASAQRIVELAGQPLLRTVCTLDLYNNVSGPAGAAALAASPHTEYLSCLKLGNNAIGTAGVQALAASSGLPRLRSLSLYGNGIGNEGVESLAASPLLSRVRRLGLGANEITAAGAAALINSPHIANLTWLQLTGNQLHPEMIGALRQHFGDALVWR
jgi:uncharacterized protein (TIGR02996 family)